MRAHMESTHMKRTIKAHAREAHIWADTQERERERERERARAHGHTYMGTRMRALQISKNAAFARLALTLRSHRANLPVLFANQALPKTTSK